MAPSPIPTNVNAHGGGGDSIDVVREGQQYGTMTVNSNSNSNHIIPPSYTPPLGRGPMGGNGGGSGAGIINVGGSYKQRMFISASERRESARSDLQSPGSIDQCEHHYSR